MIEAMQWGILILNGPGFFGFPFSTHFPSFLPHLLLSSLLPALHLALLPPPHPLSPLPPYCSATTWRRWCRERRRRWLRRRRFRSASWHRRRRSKCRLPWRRCKLGWEWSQWRRPCWCYEPAVRNKRKETSREISCTVGRCSPRRWSVTTESRDLGETRYISKEWRAGMRCFVFVLSCSKVFHLFHHNLINSIRIVLFMLNNVWSLKNFFIELNYSI